MDAPKPPKSKYVPVDLATKAEVKSFNAYKPNDLTQLSSDLKKKVIDLRDAAKNLDLVRVVEIVAYNPDVAKIGYPHKVVLKRMYEPDLSAKDQNTIQWILNSLIQHGADINKPIITTTTQKDLKITEQSSPAIEVWKHAKIVPNLWKFLQTKAPILPGEIKFEPVMYMKEIEKTSYIKEYEDYIVLN